MKTLLLVFCLNFVVIQNIFSQEIFLVSKSESNIQLDSHRLNLFNIIKNRPSSAKVMLLKNKEINKIKALKEISIEIFDQGIIKFKNKKIENINI